MSSESSGPPEPENMLEVYARRGAEEREKYHALPAQRRPETCRQAAATIEERMRSLENTPDEQAERRRRELDALAVRQEKQRRSRSFTDYLHARGREYEHCTLPSFECTRRSQQEAKELVQIYIDEFLDQFVEGAGLTFYGPCGAGKDHLAAAVCRAACLQHGKRVVWTSGTKLFNGMKDCFADRSPVTSEEFRRRLELAEVLCISDPIVAIERRGAVAGDAHPTAHNYGLSPFEANIINEIADERCNHCRPTLLTINAADENAVAKLLPHQAVDRWAKKNIPIRCFWPSWRTAHRPTLQLAGAP